ncbi:MAG TPA: hypothetical protein VFP32_01435 [Candidatus Saccharimonadales bacterium]|nr:hypothetical protein [Candidatus Saccharimonadales bacterium]
MSETLPSSPATTIPEAEQLDLTSEQGWNQQLDLSGEAGWAPEQTNLTGEPGWNGGSASASPETGQPISQPMGQDSEQYRTLEFDVEQPATASLDSLPEPIPAAETAPAAGPQEQVQPQVQEQAKSLSPEDQKRIAGEAKEYFNSLDKYFDNSEASRDPKAPKTVEQMRQQLAQYEQSVKDAYLEEFKTLGIENVDGKWAMAPEIIDQVNEAIAKAKQQKIAEFARQLRYGPEENKDKDVNKARESLTKLLNMSDEQFTQLRRDWEQHSIGRAYEAATKEDKNYKVGEQRQAARSEIDRLQEQYGGTLLEVARLPLDREAGGQTRAALDTYLERQRQIKNSPNRLVDTEVASAISRGQAVRDLETQLKQKYQAEGLDPVQIQDRLEESRGALQSWVENIQNGPKALEDLNTFEAQQDKERRLSAKRQKVREYFAAVLLPKAVRGVFNRSEAKAEAPEAAPQIDLKEMMGRGVDHNGSHTRAGGEALLGGGSGGSGESLWRKTMANVELARNLGRNEGRLLQAMIYMALVPKGLEDGAAAAWQAIPEKTKKEARKKMVMGMSVTARAIVRAKVKAVEKARKAGATGAAAAALRIGTLRA